MSNPPPRRALRKAPDADNNPALPPRPLVSVPAAPTGAPGAAAPVVPPTPEEPAEPAPFSEGSTSDTLRTDDPPTHKKGKGRKHKADRAGIAVPAKAAKDKTVVVEVPMPKSLRTRLDERADALGYTREEAVLLLLQAWIDG